MVNHITFPNLGLDFNINRVAFNIFGIEIYWYAIIITTGIILGYLYAIWLGKKNGVSSDTLSDILLVGLPSSIVCARLYYVIFEWEQYKNNIWSVFNLRQGGIAIYGAVIGAVIAVLIYCKIKKIKPLKICDIGCISLLIGQAIGRWGNFVNAEAYGSTTESFLKMGIYEYGSVSYHHPTFLYESLWNFAGLILLHFLYKKRKTDGQIFFLYILWYGIGRFFIEGLRTDSLYLGPIRISQLVGIVSAAGAVVALVIISKKAKNKAE